MPLKLYWPTTNNRILQRFREHPEWYKGFGLPGHEGLDFSITHGGEIFCCADGIVAEVRWDAEKYAETRQGTYAYGNQVRVRHALPEGEYFTIYAHLLEPRVQPGDSIKAGDLIGLGDSTGNSTGDHLHLTLKKTGASAAGETDYPRDLIDPEPFLQPFGVKPDASGGTGTGAPPTTTPQGIDGLKYGSDVTIPDGTVMTPGQAFTKTWRVTNSGTTAWGPGYVLRFAEGNQLSAPNSFPLTPAQPGQTVDITIPLNAPVAPGRYISKWVAANKLGYSFGATINVQISVVAQPAPTPPTPTPQPVPTVPANVLKFLGDGNFPPGGLVLGGQQLVKTWKIQNAGSAAWDNRYSVVYVNGEPIKQTSFNPLPPLQPGQQGEVSVMIITPINPGNFQCIWQARGPDGQVFGDLLVFEFGLQTAENEPI